MTHNEFDHLLHSINTLSPEQMRQLCRELESRLATAQHPAAGQGALGQPQKPIWERIQEMTADVPDEVWDAVPTDLAEQHDHYIYGTPKRPTA